MSNGNEPTAAPRQPSPRGMHVQPCQMTFETAAKVVPTPTGGSVRLVSLRIEHPTGASEFVFAAEFAKQIANGLIGAATGLTLPGR